MPRRTYDPRKGRRRGQGPGMDTEPLLHDLRRMAERRRPRTPNQPRQERSA